MQFKVPKYFIVCLSFLLLLSAASVASAQTANAPAFQQAMARIDKVAGSAGVQIIALPSGRVVCQSRSKNQFVPASLVKLLTSYAALKKLGPSFRFTTTIFAAEEPSAGVISGDIWIKGNGDPFFVSDKAPLLVQALRERGVRQIRGGIHVDNSFFQPASEHICLDAGCVGVYNPVVSSTAIDYNMLTVKLTFPAKGAKTPKIDSAPAGDYVSLNGQAVAGKKGADSLRLRSLGATGDGQEQFQLSGQLSARGARARQYRFNVTDPAGLYAHAMRALLIRSGIKVSGSSAKEGVVPPQAKAIAFYDSPPLSELIAGLNKYSNNFMAEMLLKALGGHVAGAPGTTSKGISVVRNALKEAGIPEEMGALDCGSGLSRFCRISPDTFCRLLSAAWQDPAIGSDFVASLAANAGVGTLRGRMHRPGLTVRGKTGTLNDVVGFAGYVTGPSGNTFAAVIILNDVTDRTRARKAIDLLLEEVAFSD
ncbi:MAG: D-alanyl-D-alanine carboxypeptidase/D-alanyl-D-alanine-endopeptidase [Syntrophobacteraceae bacterium]